MDVKKQALINASQLPSMDPAEHLKTEESITAFLEAARLDKPEERAYALAIVERARKRWNLPAG
jgi:DNA-binding phage protein